MPQQDSVHWAVKTPGCGISLSPHRWSSSSLCGVLGLGQHSLQLSPDGSRGLWLDVNMGSCRLSGPLEGCSGAFPSSFPIPPGLGGSPGVPGWLPLWPSLLSCLGGRLPCSPAWPCCRHSTHSLLTRPPSPTPSRPRRLFISGDQCPRWAQVSWQHHPICLPLGLEDLGAHLDPLARLRYLVQTADFEAHEFVTTLPPQ